MKNDADLTNQPLLGDGAKWTDRGATSLAPFSPCASTRLAHVYAALRLGSKDDECLWDLGCGDGRVLIEAAVRFPRLRVVGVELDAPCLEACKAGALAAGVEDRCSWRLVDLTEAPAGFLGTNADQTLPSPTTVLAFLTGAGLSTLAPTLHREHAAADFGGLVGRIGATVSVSDASTQPSALV